MIKKKLFGLPAGIPLEEIVNDAEAGAGTFVMEILPLSRIEVDPDNPRRLGLNPQSPRELDPNDPELERKRELLASIESLAANIAHHKVQQPIKVYRHEKGFRIVFGERRFLASMLAGEKTIPAWVLPEKPKFLRALQFSENEHHDKLDTWERLESVRLVVEEFEFHGEETINSATALSSLTGLRLSMANNYFDLLHAPSEILETLRNRTLTNIQLAAEIAREPDPVKRQEALQAVQSGLTADGVRNLLKISNKPVASHGGSRGRPATKVSFGSTRNTFVVRRIMERVLGDEIGATVGEVQWDDFNSVTQAWKKFIALVEAEMQGESGQ